MARVKICGITREADLRAAVDAGADAVGVISEVPVDSPREVDPAGAAELLADVPAFVTATLVTMPDSAASATAAVDSVGPDAIQVHGDLPAGDLRSLRESVPARVIAAVDAADPDRVRAVAPAVDAVLMDSVDESGGGGTGETHDWTATAEVAAGVDAPVVLAGGLTPDNVAEAVETVRPFAVDVASGVERTGGRKDHDAVDAFVANATAAGTGGRTELSEGPEEVPT